MKGTVTLPFIACWSSVISKGDPRQNEAVLVCSSRRITEGLSIRRTSRKRKHHQGILRDHPVEKRKRQKELQGTNRMSLCSVHSR